MAPIIPHHVSTTTFTLLHNLFVYTSGPMRSSGPQIHWEVRDLTPRDRGAGWGMMSTSSVRVADEDSSLNVGLVLDSAYVIKKVSCIRDG